MYRCALIIFLFFSLTQNVFAQGTAYTRYFYPENQNYPAHSIHYPHYYNNYRQYVYEEPQARKSILRKVSDYFGGQLTGFTPPIYPSYHPSTTSYYPQNCTNSNVVEYSNPWFRHGYNINNYNTGSGSSVRILD